MNKFVKASHIFQWIIIGLIHSFPLVLALPFFASLGWAWWVYFLPVGLVPLGLVAVPLALIGRNDEMGKFYGRYFATIWFIWDNIGEKGDPPVPQWWYDKAASGKAGILAKWFPRWWWFAVRNPANGVRWLFKDREAKFEGWESKNMEPQDLVDAGVKEATRWAYNGMFAGWKKVKIESENTYSEYWFGWKVGSDVDGMGWTAQVRRKREF